MSAKMADGPKETKGGERRGPRRGRRFRPLARDVAIVGWVAEAGLTTREQVMRLFFSPGGRSRCQARLTLLYRERYLDRLAGRQPNQPDVYLLSRRSVNGLRVLRAQGREAHPHPFSAARLQHQLAINACRVQVTAACREPGLSLLSWTSEAELRELFRRQPILPDAHFQVARQTPAGERRAAFFLEVERSDKSDRALREKFQAYGRLYYGGDYERTFGGRALRVLFLIDESFGIRPERRIEKFSELAGRLGVTLLRFAPLRQFQALSPREAFSAPIWRRPDQEGFSGLFEKGDA